MTIKEALAFAVLTLKEASQTPKKEAMMLLAFTMNRPIVWIMAHDEEKVENEELFFEYIKRRSNHEPMAYIVGSVEFYGRTFIVKNGVLVPRPETELLVELVVKQIKSLDLENSFATDIGCGSGIIGCTLALELPNIRILCCDKSKTALECSSENIKKFNLKNIELKECDCYEGLPKLLPIVVSNPPYIASSYNLPKTVALEPHLALFSGVDGCDMLYKLIDEAKNYGVKLLACEMGYDQKEAMNQKLIENSAKKIEFYKDYSGFDRGFVACF